MKDISCHPLSLLPGASNSGLRLLSSKFQIFCHFKSNVKFIQYQLFIKNTEIQQYSITISGETVIWLKIVILQ